MFGGYLSERFMVCLIHATLTGIFFWFIYQRKFFIGYMAVVFLHALVNLGAILLMLGLISPGITNLLLIISLLIVVFVFEQVRRAWQKSFVKEEKEQDVIYFRRAD